MGEYYAAKTSSILFQGSASRTSFSKRWKMSWHSRTWIMGKISNMHALTITMTFIRFDDAISSF